MADPMRLNHCGCNHWTTPTCPSRNCPWQGKRPIDVCGDVNCTYCNLSSATAKESKYKTTSEARSLPTAQEDRWLRNAAKRASKVVASGKLLQLDTCPLPTHWCACKGNWCRLLGRNLRD